MKWSAEVEAKRQKIQAIGAELVEVIGPKRASCGHRRWVGKRLSIMGNMAGVKSLDAALADGLLSEGCEHDVAAMLDFS